MCMYVCIYAEVSAFDKIYKVDFTSPLVIIKLDMRNIH